MSEHEPNVILEGKHIMSTTVYNNHTGKKELNEIVVDNVEIRGNNLWVDVTKERQLKELVSIAVDLEEAIIDKIRKLPNYGEECNCMEPHFYYWVDSYDKGRISACCINCGGKH